MTLLNNSLLISQLRMEILKHMMEFDDMLSTEIYKLFWFPTPMLQIKNKLQKDIYDTIKS